VVVWMASRLGRAPRAAALALVAVHRVNSFASSLKVLHRSGAERRTRSSSACSWRISALPAGSTSARSVTYRFMAFCTVANSQKIQSHCLTSLVQVPPPALEGHGLRRGVMRTMVELRCPLRKNFRGMVFSIFQTLEAFFQVPNLVPKSDKFSFDEKLEQ
jgi:hypothetical protein